MGMFTCGRIIFAEFVLIDEGSRFLEGRDCGDIRVPQRILSIIYNNMDTYNKIYLQNFQFPWCVLSTISKQHQRFHLNVKAMHKIK